MFFPDNLSVLGNKVLEVTSLKSSKNAREPFLKMYWEHLQPNYLEFSSLFQVIWILEYTAITQIYLGTESLEATATSFKRCTHQKCACKENTAICIEGLTNQHNKQASPEKDGREVYASTWLNTLVRLQYLGLPIINSIMASWALAAITTWYECLERKNVLLWCLKFLLSNIGRRICGNAIKGCLLDACPQAIFSLIRLEEIKKQLDCICGTRNSV